MMHNSQKLFNSIKKGRSLLLLPFFIFIASCSLDQSKNGRVMMHSSTDRNSFTFLVNDDFIEKNSDSKPDKNNPKLNQAEAKLLYKLMAQKKYCLNNYNNPTFKINSRQERVYDMTFAHLIEQSYKARPIVPRTYFGECVVVE